MWADGVRVYIGSKPWSSQPPWGFVGKKGEDAKKYLYFFFFFFAEAKALAEKQMNEAMAMAQGKCVLQ